MKYMYIKDSVDIEIPESFKIQDSITKESVMIKDAVLAPGDFKDKALEITVDATHCGYFNRNNYYYTYEGMAAGAGTFLEPYAKPFLVEHQGSSKPVGRMTAAAFISIPNGTYRFDTEESKVKGRPTGKIRLKAMITDPEAIKDVLDSRFLTVSIGGRPLETPTCSACGEKAEAGMFGIHLTCEHEMGDVDEKKGYVGLRVGRMDYGECSFVNHPADYTSDHAARVVGMTLVANTENSILPTFDNIEFGEGYLQDKIQKKEDEDMAVSKEVLDKAAELGIEVKEGMSEEDVQALISAKEDELKSQTSDDDTSDGDSTSDGDGADDTEKTFDELVAEMEVALDECEGCDEDINKFWEDESEEDLKNLEEMSKEYDSYIQDDPDGLIPEDAKLSTEQRKKLSAKTFCGPNRSFPVPDCAHVTAARRLIGRYKGPGSKAKILACVNRKAKSMGCDKKNDADEQSVLAQLEAKLLAMTQERDSLAEKIKSLESDVTEKTNAIQASDKKIIELTAELKDAMVEKVIDLSLIMRKEEVKSLTSAKDKEEYDANYATLKEGFSEREIGSLSDKLNDLKGEFKVVSITEQISSPTLDDGEDITDPIDKILAGRNDEDKSKNVAEIVFGKGYKENKEEK
jgi:hypothetical protein